MKTDTTRTKKAPKRVLYAANVIGLVNDDGSTTDSVVEFLDPFRHIATKDVDSLHTHLARGKDILLSCNSKGVCRLVDSEDNRDIVATVISQTTKKSQSACQVIVSSLKHHIVSTKASESKDEE